MNSVVNSRIHSANTSEKIHDHLLKVIIIGESSVGKSNIALQFTQKKFVANHDLTIGIEFAAKIVSRNKKKYKIQIWDTAGQETFRSMTRSFYRSCVGCLIVYDITNRASFESVEYWLNDLLENAGPFVAKVLVGNKTDLIVDRVVDTEEGIELAQKYNIPFIETSAKNFVNVNDTFNLIIDQIDKKISSGELKIIVTTEKINLISHVRKEKQCSC